MRTSQVKNLDELNGTHGEYWLYIHRDCCEEATEESTDMQRWPSGFKSFGMFDAYHRWI